MPRVTITALVCQLNKGKASWRFLYSGRHLLCSILRVGGKIDCESGIIVGSHLRSEASQYFAQVPHETLII